MRKRNLKLTATAMAVVLSMAVMYGCSNNNITPENSQISAVNPIGLFSNQTSQSSVSEAPVPESSVPVAESSIPVVESSAPAAISTPTVESSAPVVSSTPVVESSAPVVSSTPVVESSAPVVSSTPVVESSVPAGQSSVPSSTSKPTTPVTLKQFIEQNGGEQALEQLKKQNSNSNLDVDVYLEGENTLVYDMNYKQTLPLDEDTLELLRKNFDTSFAAMKATFKQQVTPANGVNISNFIIRIIVKNGDGTEIYRTDLDPFS